MKKTCSTWIKVDMLARLVPDWFDSDEKKCNSGFLEITVKEPIVPALPLIKPVKRFIPI
ncbi:MAG: hypothetical protein H6577_18265 [Lewinellaceae bacterium]|nr:hypothetical protein [Saprospiraceae bacterium]MCB9340071.1 hypothetical protein [Lewinellaceae bacterium]